MYNNYAHKSIALKYGVQSILEYIAIQVFNLQRLSTYVYTCLYNNEFYTTYKFHESLTINDVAMFIYSKILITTNHKPHGDVQCTVVILPGRTLSSQLIWGQSGPRSQ